MSTNSITSEVCCLCRVTAPEGLTLHGVVPFCPVCSGVVKSFPQDDRRLLLKRLEIPLRSALDAMNKARWALGMDVLGLKAE